MNKYIKILRSENAMTAIRIADNKAIAVQQFGVNLLSDFFAFLDVSEKTQATYQRALVCHFHFLLCDDYCVSA